MTNENKFFDSYFDPPKSHANQGVPDPGRVHREYHYGYQQKFMNKM